MTESIPALVVVSHETPPCETQAALRSSDAAQPAPAHHAESAYCSTATASKMEVVQPATAGTPGVDAARAIARAICVEYRLSPEAYDRHGGEHPLIPVIARHVAPLAQEVEKLKAERDAAQRHAAHMESEGGRMQARATEAEARVAQAVEALEPFSKAAGIIAWTERATTVRYDDAAAFRSGLAWRDGEGTRTLTIGDFRRARTAAAAIRGDTQNGR